MIPFIKKYAKAIVAAIDDDWDGLHQLLTLHSVDDELKVGSRLGH